VGVGVSAACSRGGSVEKGFGIIGVVRPLPMLVIMPPSSRRGNGPGGVDDRFWSAEGLQGSDAALNRPQQGGAEVFHPSLWGNIGASGGFRTPFSLHLRGRYPFRATLSVTLTCPVASL
jgi:hypothetical protein